MNKLNVRKAARMAKEFSAEYEKRLGVGKMISMYSNYKQPQVHVSGGKAGLMSLFPGQEITETPRVTDSDNPIEYSVMFDGVKFLSI